MSHQMPCVAWDIKKYTMYVAVGLFLSVTQNSVAKPNAITHASFTFRNGDMHTHALVDSGGVAIAEGDIIFGKSEDFFRSSDPDSRTIRGLSNTSYGRIWPNGIVPYRLHDSLSASTRQNVREAVEHWNSFQAITMVERNSKNASAYPDFIDFVNDGRCASWIGYQGGGAQSIYTGDNCSAGTMIHEIGHALGLLHEHTRSDRDQFVTIHWDRIDENMHINFEILKGNLALGEYDYGSIMHYGEYFFSKPTNVLPTIEPLMSTGQAIGQRIATSPGDRAAVAKLYESNISLIASSNASTTAGSATEVSFQVTNNTSVGSNSLTINVPVPEDSRLLSYSSASWTCQQANEGLDIQCSTPALSAGASSNLAINLTATKTPGTMQLDAQLSSRTLDTDLSDNRDTTSIKILAAVNNKAPVNEPVIASANDISTQKTGTQPTQQANAAGGGSADLRTLALLLIILTVSALSSRLNPLRSKASSRF